MYILDKLNIPQQNAVTYSKKNLLVLAGAGSGKTRVLVQRVVWLMQEQSLQPYNIMAVTFTNKAARELKARIESILGYSSSGMAIGTFHGLCNRFLRIHWQEAGLPQYFQVIDSEDQLRLIKRILKEMEIDDKRWPPKQVQHFINRHKDKGLRSAMVTNTTDFFQKHLQQIYSRYEETCISRGIVDFGELLLRAYELWHDNADLLQHYQNKFNHVLVDEFQDTNDIQYKWLRLLTHNTSIGFTVVGDDDQSIYGWRGARIENIQHFLDDYSDAQAIRLEQNYRSTTTILNAANHIISRNKGRLGKKLWTDAGQGDQIQLYGAYNDLEEARFIVDNIKSQHQNGYEYKSISVLYRSNAQSRSLEELMIHGNVPYRIYGGLRFYERAEVKNSIAYLRMMVNLQDETAFERIINLPTRGIGNQSLEIIRSHARSNKIPMWNALLEVLKDGILSPRASKACISFVAIITRLQEKINNQPLSKQVEIVVKDSGLYDFHGSEKGKIGESRIENLQELFRASSQFEEQTDSDNPIIEFLDHASLEAGEGQADEHKDAVQLMTLHSAKGLEFPIVYLTGLEEGLFPHFMSMEDPTKLEEERRLCYVGITRSMEKLYITYAQSRRMHGTQVNNRVSRFIKEIPDNLIHEVRMQISYKRPTFTHAIQNTHKYNNIVPHDEDSEFCIGTKVSHRLFGSGVIVNQEGEGEKTRVQVNFNSQGSKWLVLAYAKLQVI